MGKSECANGGAHYRNNKTMRKFSVPASFFAGNGERDVQSFVSNFLATHPYFAREWFRENASADMVQAWLVDRGASLADPWVIPEAERNALSATYAAMSRCGRNSVTSELFRDMVLGPKHRKKSCQERLVNREILQHQLKKLDEHEMLMELIRDIANELDIDTLCHKILVNVSMLTKSDRGSLFLAKGSRGNRVLVAKLFDVTPCSVLEDALCAAEQHLKIPPIPFGVGIAGYVAQTKDTVIIKDAYQDPRFNKEIDARTGYRTVSIMCMPILNFKGDVIGVAQCINKVSGDHEFTKQDEEVFRKYLTFCGIGIQNAQLFEMSLQEFKRNQLLLSLAQSIFEEYSSLEHLINKIMTKAEDLLQCEKCKVYLVDTELNAGEAYKKDLEEEKPTKMPNTGIPRKFSRPEDVIFTTVFELCQGEDMIHHSDSNNYSGTDALHAEFARQVAATGQTLNWTDSSDHYLSNGNSESWLQQMNGIKAGSSILSIPIFNSEQKVIGVAQLVNKPKGEPFTEIDVMIFEAFSIFCGLGIHNTQMYESAMKLMAKQRVALEVLSYHASSSVQETKKLMNLAIPSAEHFSLYNFDFSDFKLSDDDTCQAALRMFMDLELISKFHIPYQVICRWILSVRKNYRPVIYHNWRHALNVTQTMFAMLNTGQMGHLMSNLEKLALLVACLCHDLDHRGTNNSFQTKIDSPLATLYSTSTMEHHHFDQCIMILHSEGNNIFQSLSPEDYREAIGMIESAILSTDLALYFKKKDRFFQLVESGGTSWQEQSNKDLLRGMMMTACDVSAICKPWEVQRKIAEMVASEFFQQGDLEKERLNEQPIAMMDRDKKDELPKMQVGFIDVICIPVYKALTVLQPALLPLLKGCQDNKQNWQNLINDYEYKITDDASSHICKNGFPVKCENHVHITEKEPPHQENANGLGGVSNSVGKMKKFGQKTHKCSSRYKCGNPICSVL